MQFYLFDGQVYDSWDNVIDAVAEAHPEALDDALVELYESEVEEISEEEAYKLLEAEQELALDRILAQQELDDFEAWGGGYSDYW